MKNLKELSKMHLSGNIGEIWLNFVVSSYNYKEMISFMKLANHIKANVRFTEYRKWGNVELDNQYDNIAIFNPTHPEYENYYKIINNEIFNQPNCFINNILRPLTK